MTLTEYIFRGPGRLILVMALVHSLVHGHVLSSPWLTLSTRKFYVARALQNCHRMKRTVPNPLPASFIRGGTSKGVFVHRKYLPEDRSEWASMFVKLMGSPDPEHSRQLNGMGCGESSTSKVMVIEPPTTTQAEAGIDMQYTFAQIGVKDSDVDYAGNCGNLSSVVGVFAVDEGICVPKLSVSDSTGETLGTVRMWNTNTNKEIHATFPLTSHMKADLDKEQVSIAGVPGKASQIVLDFVHPGGARTGKLLPSGNAVDELVISTGNGTEKRYSASLVDATNPTVFVNSEEIFGSKYLPSIEVYAKTGLSSLQDTLESLRQAGAVQMGLDPSAQAQPKIGIVGFPKASGELVASDGIPHEIEIHVMSLDVVHRAVPVTVGLCLGVAGATKGTIVHKIVEEVRVTSNPDPGRLQQGLIRLKHPSGVIDVGAQFDNEGNATSAKVIRTGRRLMQGAVWW